MAWPTRVLTVLLTLLAAGCGAAEEQPAASDGDAVLVVRQTFVGGALYVEGAYSYARVEAASGGQADEQRLSGDGLEQSTTFRLAGGAYRLFSWQRPCDGNCSYLDPPTDRCDAPFSVEPGTALTAIVTVSPGRGCSIAFTRLDARAEAEVAALAAAEAAHYARYGRYTSRIADLFARTKDGPAAVANAAGLDVQLDTSSDGKTLILRVTSPSVALTRVLVRGRRLRASCQVLADGGRCPA
jgi:hypothetical protein